ncbi:hypothetical protein AB0M80_05485 [Amycolatopsis sp. NPDC051045]|uniref:hypothetical protein n=1 Tax=Amycolatopsis sp. NPDC051045 TaxID=3156922 RepID=UPI00342117F7
MFPGRATTIAAVAAVFLASAAPADARPAGGYGVCSVFRTVTWHSWSPGPGGTYRPTPYRKPYAFTVTFSYELSSSSRAAASRR